MHTDRTSLVGTIGSNGRSDIHTHTRVVCTILVILICTLSFYHHKTISNYTSAKRATIHDKSGSTTIEVVEAVVLVVGGERNIPN